jgi:hypothetical protein
VTDQERREGEAAARRAVATFGPVVGAEVAARVHGLPDTDPEQFAVTVGVIARDVLSRRLREASDGLTVMNLMFPCGPRGLN